MFADENKMVPFLHSDSDHQFSDTERPLLSVVIPTYCRSQHLERCLESLEKQSAKPSSFEVILVENGPKEGVENMAEVFRKKGLKVKYFYELNAGANQARNRGIRESRGRYLAFIDDDAQAGINWISAIIHGFQKNHPQPACVGGPINPIWESEKPNWFAGQFLRVLGIINCAPHPCWLRNTQFFWNSNIAIQRELLLTVGGFPLDNGRSNDEILPQILLTELGYGRFYDPSISVEHVIHKSRLRRAWFIKRYYWQGRADGILFRLKESRKRVGFGKVLVEIIEDLPNVTYMKAACVITYSIGWIFSRVRGFNSVNKSEFSRTGVR